jgi:catalase
LLAQVDQSLANSVAEGLGAKVPKKLDKPLNMSVPGGADPRKFQPKKVDQAIDSSPALSMVNNPNFPNDSIKTRKIAVLIADGFDDSAVDEMNKTLLTAGAMPKTVAPHLGVVTGANGNQVKADFSFLTASSVLFDAVFVPGGDESIAALSKEKDAAEFLTEAYKHCKTIAGSGAGVGLLATSLVGDFTESDEVGEGVAVDKGVVTSRAGSIKDVAEAFVAAIALHRHWERELGP